MMHPRRCQGRQTASGRILPAGLLLLIAAGPLLANGPDLTAAEEQDGRRTVLGFRHELLDARNPHEASRLYLADDFHNHDRAEPSGAEAYAVYAGKPGALDAIAPTPLFTLSDGALTLVAYPVAAGRFTATLYEVRNGRILQSWFSGPPEPSDAAPRSARMEPVVVTSADRVTRDANKALVEGFIDGFFLRGDNRAVGVLAPDIASHVAGIPSGAGFAAVGRKHPERLMPAGAPAELFALADGELVAIGFAIPYANDPGARFALSIARVREGRITEWWYSGLPAKR